VLGSARGGRGNCAVDISILTFTICSNTNSYTSAPSDTKSSTCEDNLHMEVYLWEPSGSSTCDDNLHMEVYLWGLGESSTCDDNLHVEVYLWGLSESSTCDNDFTYGTFAACYLCDSLDIERYIDS
jgi:hypothetical protein